MQRFRVEREKRVALELEVSPGGEPAQKRLARSRSDPDLMVQVAHDGAGAEFWFAPRDDVPPSPTPTAESVERDDDESSQASERAVAWSVEEDLLIIRLYDEHGRRWAKIASQLPGRTDNGVRNRWNRMAQAQTQRVKLGPEHGYRCRRCGQPKRGHICAAITRGEALEGDSLAQKAAALTVLSATKHNVGVAEPLTQLTPLVVTAHPLTHAPWPGIPTATAVPWPVNSAMALQHLPQSSAYPVYNGPQQVQSYPAAPPLAMPRQQQVPPPQPSIDDEPALEGIRNMDDANFHELLFSLQQSEPSEGNVHYNEYDPPAHAAYGTHPYAPHESLHGTASSVGTSAPAAYAPPVYSQPLHGAAGGAHEAWYGAAKTGGWDQQGLPYAFDPSAPLGQLSDLLLGQATTNVASMILDERLLTAAHPHCQQRARQPNLVKHEQRAKSRGIDGAPMGAWPAGFAMA